MGFEASANNPVLKSFFWTLYLPYIPLGVLCARLVACEYPNLY